MEVELRCVYIVALPPAVNCWIQRACQSIISHLSGIKAPAVMLPAADSGDPGFFVWIGILMAQCCQDMIGAKTVTWFAAAVMKFW